MADSYLDEPDIHPPSGELDSEPDLSPEKVKELNDAHVREVVETARKAAPAPKSKWEQFKDALTPSRDTEDKVKHFGQEYVDPAVRGATQGATFKFGDELKGAGAVLDTLRGFNQDKSLPSTPGYEVHAPLSWDEYKDALGKLPDIYSKARDADRAGNAAAKARSPYVYGGSELAGAMAMPLPGPGKAKSLWDAAQLGAKVGAPLAVATGIGGDDKPLSETSPVEVGLNGASGAVLGGLGGAAGEKASQFLSGLAERGAVKAVGARPGINNQLAKLGVRDEVGVNKLGREFLDEGLIPWSGSKQEALNRAKAIQDTASNRIGSDLTGADSAAQVGVGPAFDYARLGAAANEPISKLGTVEQRAAGKAEGLAQDLEDQGLMHYDPQGHGTKVTNPSQIPPNTVPAGFQKANEQKSAAWRSADFRSDPKLSAEIYSDVNRAARDNIQQQLEESIEQRALKMGYSPQRAKDTAEKRIAEYRDAAQRYGTGAKAEDLLKEYMSREGAHAGMGYTATQLASNALLGGAAHGGMLQEGIPAALATGFLAQLAKKRGWGPVARGSDVMSKVVPSAAVKAGPLLVGDKRPWQSFTNADEEDKNQK